MPKVPGAVLWPDAMKPYELEKPAKPESKVPLEMSSAPQMGAAALRSEEAMMVRMDVFIFGLLVVMCWSGFMDGKLGERRLTTSSSATAERGAVAAWRAERRRRKHVP